MTRLRFAIFDTAIGPCGIAWGDRGVVRVQLPEASEAKTRARLVRGLADAREAAPPPDVQRALDGIFALLRGEPSDLSAVALDMDAVPPFDRRVYEVARTVLPGATISYGEIAARLGEHEDPREVGRAMGQNPFSIVVPCHRVVGAGGKHGGFSAYGGLSTKLRMLEIEARANGALALFDRH